MTVFDGMRVKPSQRSRLPELAGTVFVLAQIEMFVGVLETPVRPKEHRRTNVAPQALLAAGEEYGDGVFEDDRPFGGLTQVRGHGALGFGEHSVGLERC